MATKDCCKSTERKKLPSNDSFGNEDRHAQYSNLDLKKNHKCEDLKFGEFSSKKELKNERKNYGFEDRNNSNRSSKNDFGKKKKKYNLSKSLENLSVTHTKDDKFEKPENLNKSNNTLSLHIAAYENSIENEKFDNKILDNKCVDSIEDKKDTFDFARQNSEQSNEAEIMNFKASQKLFNPDEHSNKEESKNANSSSKNHKKFPDHFFKGVRNGAEGLLYEVSRFSMKFPASRGLNVYDKAFKTVKGKAACLFRVDKPHPSTPYHHININPKVSGFPDPHMKISSADGTFSAATKTGKVLNFANKVAVPVAIAIDTGRVANAVYKDVKNGTSRNTVETGASIAGGWGCGYVGGVTGAAIGTTIFPGPGTFIGAVVGGVVGGIGGAFGAEKVVEVAGDKYEYNIVERKCRGCHAIFKVKLYKKKEKDKILCEKCFTLLFC